MCTASPALGCVEAECTCRGEAVECVDLDTIVDVHE